MCELSWSAALSFLYICCMILITAFFAICSSELTLYAMANIFESSSGILAHVLAARKLLENLNIVLFNYT